MVEKSHTAGQHAWWPTFVDPLRHVGESIAGFFAPSTDASATENAYEIEMELPGVPNDNIDVSVHDRTLTVSGEKRSARTEEGRTFFFTERTYGSFQRSFRLPEDADTKNIVAENKDGILKLQIGKIASAEEPTRRIKVRAL